MIIGLMPPFASFAATSGSGDGDGDGVGVGDGVGLADGYGDGVVSVKLIRSVLSTLLSRYTSLSFARSMTI